MSDQRPRVIAVGDVMVELARQSDGRFGLGRGGDTFNTAVYLASAGVNVAYATAVGDDRYSDAIVAMAQAEGIAADLILRAPGRLPGIYLVESGTEGERRFSYWRDASPARQLFELADWGRIAEAMMAAKLIYFSGVTLSLYSNVGLGRFLATVEFARKNGARIAFDGNFRPHAWRGDLVRTRAVFAEALKRVDLALPAYDDEAVLWGDPSPEATIARLQAFGIGEIVVKNGPNSALVFSAGETVPVPVPEVIEPVDTAAAGDSFNAGYLAARLSGDAPLAAAAAAHRLAATKLRHRGTLMPRDASAMH